MELEERPHGRLAPILDRCPLQTPGSTTAPEAAGARHPVTTARLPRQWKHWWTRNISLVLEHGPDGGDPRDYLALERTYLGWYRTSVAVTSLGVVVTQLFVFQSLDSTKGKIIGAILAFGGISTCLLGCIRYFRQQSLLVHGRILCGGWHSTIVLLLLTIIILTILIIVLVEN